MVSDATESRFSHYSQPHSPQLELDDPLFYQDHLQPMYVGPEVAARYYPGPAHGPAYFVPSMSSYPQVADPSVSLSSLEHSPTWDLQSQHNASHQDAAFEFIPSQESVDVYSIPQYNMSMHTYDSFEFQTLREHNMNAAMASQVA